MKRAMLIALAAALAGCATLDGKLDNRIACSVAKDKLFFISEYGPVGIAATVNDMDRAAVCK